MRIIKVTCLCHEEEHQIDISQAGREIAKFNNHKRTKGKDGRFKSNKEIKKDTNKCDICKGGGELIEDWADHNGEHKQEVYPCECTKS